MLSSDFYSIFRIGEHDISSLSGKIKIAHRDIYDGNYAEEGEPIVITAEFPKGILTDNVKLLVLDAYDLKPTYSCIGERRGGNYEYEYYVFRIKSLKEAGLYFFYFKIYSGKKIYGYKRVGGTLAFSFSLPEEKKLFQITVTKKQKKKPAKINGIIYHVFVDRFHRLGNTSLPRGGVLIEDWSSPITEYPEYPGAYLKNNTFYGGSLYGIIEKLDYLCSLGTSVLYLSPIFESPSNHKYDTADYENIDSGFGGNEAFDELVKRASKCGIKIILDGVFNHTGSDSKYFNKYSNYNSLGAFQSESSPYYSWYKFYNYPSEYECWWGIDILPRIFYENSNAESYFVDNDGIIEKWLKKGAYGFRLDVADELSDSFIRKIRNKIRNKNEDGLLYGEVWEDASNKIAYGIRKRYYLGDELSGVMNYPLRDGIIDYIRNKSCVRLSHAVYEVIFNMPREAREKSMNILGSHDTVRAISALGREEHGEKSNAELSILKMSSEEYEIAKRRLISAYTLVTALPGLPTVYYGDEAGVEGYRDPFNRRAFPWGKEDREIMRHYKTCGALRKKYDVLFDGDLHILHLDNDLFLFERKKETHRILMAYNNSEKVMKVSFSTDVKNLISNTKGREFFLSTETAYIFHISQNTKLEIGCYKE